MPQTYYGINPAPPAHGQCYDSGIVRDVLTLVNADPQAPQISTLTASSVNASTEYVIELNGVPLAYNSPASGQTVALMYQGFADAINGEPALSGLVRAEATASGMTVTSRVEGMAGAFMLTSAEANISITNVSAANAGTVPFGRCVVRTADRQGRLVQASDFAPASFVFTFTAANSQPYVLNFTVDGAPVQISITSTASATPTNIATALLSAAQGKGFTGTAQTGTLTLQGPGGSEVVLASTSAGEGGAITQGAFTAAGMPDQVLVSEFSPVYTHCGCNHASGYPGNSAMSAMRVGRICVMTEGDVDINQPVYVRVSGAGEIGAFRASPAAGCVRIDTSYPVSWHKGIGADRAILQLGY